MTARRAPQGGKVADAAWRRQRARRARAALRAKAHAEREARGEQFPTKGEAYAWGYRAGYAAAARWYRHLARRRARKERAA